MTYHNEEFQCAYGECPTLLENKIVTIFLGSYPDQNILFSTIDGIRLSDLDSPPALNLLYNALMRTVNEVPVVDILLEREQNHH